jgi:hypothetical protein
MRAAPPSGGAKLLRTCGRREGAHVRCLGSPRDAFRPFPVRPGGPRGGRRAAPAPRSGLRRRQDTQDHRRVPRCAQHRRRGHARGPGAACRLPLHPARAPRHEPGPVTLRRPVSRSGRVVLTNLGSPGRRTVTVALRAADGQGLLRRPAGGWGQRSRRLRAVRTSRAGPPAGRRGCWGRGRRGPHDVGGARTARARRPPQAPRPPAPPASPPAADPPRPRAARRQPARPRAAAGGATGTGARAQSLGRHHRFSWDVVRAAPGPLLEAQGAAVGGRLFVFGGFMSERTFAATAASHAYVPATDEWQRLADAPQELTHSPGRRGRDDDLSGRRLRRPESWARDRPGVEVRRVADSWSAGPPLPAPRGAGGAAIAGRELHFFGGTSRDGRQRLPGPARPLGARPRRGHDVGAARPAAEPAQPPGGRCAGRQGLRHRRPHGENEKWGNQSQVDVYDPATDRWTRAADMPPPAGTSPRPPSS